MNFLAVDIYRCALLLLLVNSLESLRCRSGNQRTDDRVHKVMQKCRRKDLDKENGSGKNYTMSDENESSEEDSESVGSVDEQFFFRNGNDKGSRANDSRNRANYGQSSSDNYRGKNRRNELSSMNDRGNGMSNANDGWNNRNGMQSENRENDNNDRRNRSECVSQCFFEELNLVDQRGFPERRSVMEIMTGGVQDPNVRGFIEESISECFRYLDSDTNDHRDECSFSYNLISCFIDKGKERCEDWDDDR